MRYHQIAEPNDRAFLCSLGILTQLLDLPLDAWAVLLTYTSTREGYVFAELQIVVGIHWCWKLGWNLKMCGCTMIMGASFPFSPSFACCNCIVSEQTLRWKKTQFDAAARCERGLKCRDCSAISPGLKMVTCSLCRGRSLETAHPEPVTNLLKRGEGVCTLGLLAQSVQVNKESSKWVVFEGERGRGGSSYKILQHTERERNFYWKEKNKGWHNVQIWFVNAFIYLFALKEYCALFFFCGVVFIIPCTS